MPVKTNRLLIRLRRWRWSARREARSVERISVSVIRHLVPPYSSLPGKSYPSPGRNARIFAANAVLAESAACASRFATAT